MPNRIIKESIRTSKKVNNLSDFQFRFWIYLITYVDDYGRGSADPEILRGFVFPRRKGITEEQISQSLQALANSGMINLYEVDGESYFCFPNWETHQQVRAKKSKFPQSNPIRIRIRIRIQRARARARMSRMTGLQPFGMPIHGRAEISVRRTWLISMHSIPARHRTN